MHGAYAQSRGSALGEPCYGLLVITALKLLWDGVSGYMHAG